MKIIRQVITERFNVWGLVAQHGLSVKTSKERPVWFHLSLESISIGGPKTRETVELTHGCKKSKTAKWLSTSGAFIY